MADILSLYSLLTIAGLFAMLWYFAYGFCRACRLHRSPRCGCDPEKRRKPWRNSGKR